MCFWVVLGFWGLAHFSPCHSSTPHAPLACARVSCSVLPLTGPGASTPPLDRRPRSAVHTSPPHLRATSLRRLRTEAPGPTPHLAQLQASDRLHGCVCLAARRHASRGVASRAGPLHHVSRGATPCGQAPALSASASKFVPAGLAPTQELAPRATPSTNSAAPAAYPLSSAARARKIRTVSRLACTDLRRSHRTP